MADMTYHAQCRRRRSKETDPIRRKVTTLFLSIPIVVCGPRGSAQTNLRLQIILEQNLGLAKPNRAHGRISAIQSCKKVWVVAHSQRTPALSSDIQSLPGSKLLWV